MTDQLRTTAHDPLNPSHEPDTTDPDPSVRRRYLGKYRAVVVDNVDPLQQGRVQVQVPGAGGLFPSTWAMPCFTMAAVAAGTYVRPAIGSGVWVEFEQGDPNYPIWVGQYWSAPQSLPLAARAAVSVPPVTPVVTVETATGGLSVADTPMGPFGTVCLRSGPDQITFLPDGIHITARSVSITTARFSVNGVALTVVGG